MFSKTNPRWRPRFHVKGIPGRREPGRARTEVSARRPASPAPEIRTVNLEKIKLAVAGITCTVKGK